MVGLDQSGSSGIQARGTQATGRGDCGEEGNKALPGVRRADNALFWREAEDVEQVEQVDRVTDTTERRRDRPSDRCRRKTRLCTWTPMSPVEWAGV